MAPSATVCPAAFDHNSITNWSIHTKLEARVVHEAFDNLVQYQRHHQLNRYSIPPTTMEDRLVLSVLKWGYFKLVQLCEYLSDRHGLNINQCIINQIINYLLHRSHYSISYTNYSTGERPPPNYMHTRWNNTLSCRGMVQILIRSERSLTLLDSSIDVQTMFSRPLLRKIFPAQYYTWCVHDVTMCSSTARSPIGSSTISIGCNRSR
jgi:hypothetical protein